MNTNIDFFKKIRSSKSSREEVIISFAKDARLKSGIINYVVKKGGSKDDALMVFHDAIIAFVKKVFVDTEFKIESNPNAYIFGIAKNQWYQRLRAARNTKILNIDEVQEVTQEEYSIELIKGEKYKLLKSVLNHLRSNCKDVLMHWAGGYSMQEIADKFNYKSEGMARKKKHQCYKEMINWLEDNPKYKSALND